MEINLSIKSQILALPISLVFLNLFFFITGRFLNNMWKNILTTETVMNNIENKYYIEYHEIRNIAPWMIYIFQ